MREPADQGRAVERLEFLEARIVDEALDDLTDVVGHTYVARNQIQQTCRVELGRSRRLQLDVHGLGRVQSGDDVAHDEQRMRVVLGYMVDHA